MSFYFIALFTNFSSFCVTDKKFLSDIGINKDEFHAMTWFSSWAVDGDHSSESSDNITQDETQPLEVL
jgi:Methyltransferase TRM13